VKLPRGKRRLSRRRLGSIYMTLMVFLIGVIIASGLLAAAAYALLLLVGILVNPLARLVTIPALMVFFITTLAAYMGRGKLKPINDLVHAMHDVSQGDFSVRVDAEDVSGDMGELVASFNDMARELGGLELFRKDFINNFSHEFKTPIVSIKGCPPAGARRPDRRAAPGVPGHHHLGIGPPGQHVGQRTAAVQAGKPEHRDRQGRLPAG